MTEKRKLVMATNNAGKLREARAIAGDKIEILSLDDIGYHQDIPETADTLDGNALQKVRAIKEVCDLDVFADDTGLMVDALGGAPGVYTARYAGPGCTPDDNIKLMLKNLEGVDNRHARFCTSIALSLDGEEHLFEGSVEGTIARERSGSHGFGYDPIFVPDETGVCFAEMTDEAKNAISHRGRAITAMMKWLGTLCLLVASFLTSAAATSDWVHYNTFDDRTEYVFDTEDKTYFLVQAQLYDPIYTDNNERLCFLYCLDKETDELRSYNAQNVLSQSLIRTAYYNAVKKYLLIVYSDLMIDFLYDDGTIRSITALKDYSTSGTKEIRSISFDTEGNRVYMATDFGYLALNDEKYEVASSGIYNHPIDRIVRAGDYLLIIADGKLRADALKANHISFDDFKEVQWVNGGKAMNVLPLTSQMCVYSEMGQPYEEHYILTFSDGTEIPEVKHIGSFQGATIVENKAGLMLTRPSEIASVDRQTGELNILARQESDRSYSVGSWDLKEFFYSIPREGFYSNRVDNSGEWTLTRPLVHPNSPSAFRSNFLSYDSSLGMLVNSHGMDQNFSSHNAPNPILLSALKDGKWKNLGIPYLNKDDGYRLVNPSGFARDPDNPDIFYFGSVVNGLIRYNIKDYSDVLHITRSNDTPSLPGHVSAGEPYKDWGSVYMLVYPKFDKKGNLIVSHINTEVSVSKSYRTELWIWTPEKRKASVSPETFQPFTRIKLDGLLAVKAMQALPHEGAKTSNLISIFAVRNYDQPLIVYDHNGTPDDVEDDRMVTVKSLYDDDGSISFHYMLCALEDPETGLVWLGTDNGVFTYNPAEQFTQTGKVNRIKVSRNDGTSLADYLLNGISVNNISIDNHGRKWFSIANGGLISTSPDGKTIIQEINTDNSMLPSDNVYATCYNPDNNSLMVATDAGLCEYYLTGPSSSSASESGVRAYPNPVRPDYYGWVTIDGLEDGCLVKITDSAGNLVREIGPVSGGQVQWDACNSRLDRVASGVYFVLASGTGESSYSEMTKILVVKN